jgi:hypothetical protein
MCQYLRTDSWPFAFISDKPGGGKNNNGVIKWAWQIDWSRWDDMGGAGWDLTKAYAEAEFKTSLCGNNRAWDERHPSAAKEAKETLAKALFHEALHLCSAQGAMGDEVNDHPGRRSTDFMSSLFTYDSPFNTDAADFTDECWGE